MQLWRSESRRRSVGEAKENRDSRQKTQKLPLESLTHLESHTYLVSPTFLESPTFLGSKKKAINTQYNKRLKVPLLALDFWKEKLLHWAQAFPYALYLDSCGSEMDRYGQYELLVGVGKKQVITSWDQLKNFQGNWLFGGLPYELKSQFEPSLQNTSAENISFPEVAFFVPETVIYIPKGESYLYVEGKYPDWEEILQQPVLPAEQEDVPDFQSNFTKEKYIETVEQLREHIAAGDFYEINLSQQYTADFQLQDPAALFRRLIDISPTPFSAFFKFQDKYLLCASPERFLQQQDRQLLTQPIKGTAPRGTTETEDEQLKKELLASIKERAENVMIVDLSRNDLYRSSEVNSVEVPHLFEIQSFPQVHQMVSTVTGKRQEDLSPFDVLTNTFPAGSMTGAPKVRVMNMIDQYEQVQRGIYAGSVGYIQPNGNFDLNVVIRSLIYDDSAKKLSYQVGGAITYDSDPHAEYEETLVKASGIRKLFGGS